MSQFLKSLPTSMQLLNRLLQDLTWYFRKAREVLFGIRQSIKLINFGRKLLSRPHDVLMVDRTSIYQTLPAIAPILNLSQSIVIGVAANIHPLVQQLLLSSVRVDAIAIGKCQHPSIIARLLEQTVVVNKYKAALKVRGLKPNYSIISAGAKLLGAEHPAELVGKLLIEFVHPGDRIAVRERMQQINLGNAVPLREEKFIRLDGTVIDTEVVASPFNYEGKIAAQVVIRDISLRKRLDLERSNLLTREKAARAVAEKANRSKDEFLAIVSHELRSPLNAILGWAKLLRSRTFDTATTNRALETIERNATAQTQLIEDLLDISRIIHGKIQLKPKSIELVKVITAAIDTVSLAAHAKNIQLIFPQASAIGSITGDPERLQQVVWNLLSNAIKFTPSGGKVEIALSTVTPSNSPLNYAQIAITDTGMGIDAEFLPHVFDRFLQADSTSTRSHGGLGLGLAIVRQLVEMHGGSISVVSLGKGKGAIFTVQLPLETLGQHKQFIVTEQESAITLEGLSVLVCDDEADIRDYEVAVLEIFGAKVFAVSSAAAALELLQSQPLDILLSDIGMPGEDGYSLIQKVRNLPLQIPAIALTAYAREEDRNSAISAGFQMHLTKPIEPTQLVAAIASLVKQPTIEQSLKSINS